MDKLSMRNGYIGNILTFIVLVSLWHVFSALSRLPFIPSPFTVMENIAIVFPDKITVHILYSLWRISAGVMVSLVIGAPLGMLMGYYLLLDRLLSPAIYFTYPIPKIALLPLIMLFFGLGELSKVTMIVIIVFFQVVISSRDAVKNIPEETYYSLYSLGAGRLDIFKRVIVPASLPAVLTSVRISMGTALSVLFFTEAFGTQYGMGYFIMDSWTRVHYVDMFSGIVVLSAVGFSLFLIIDVLESLLCPWKA